MLDTEGIPSIPGSRHLILLRWDRATGGMRLEVNKREAAHKLLSSCAAY